MAAAPQNANLIFRGASGKGYVIDMYLSDVVGAAATFSLDGAAATTSPNFMITPEDMTLLDAAVITGLTDTKGWRILTNDVSTGVQMRHNLFLNTLANRPSPMASFRKGTKFAITQF